MEPGSAVTHLNTQQASFRIESTRIDLLTPTGAGPVQQMLEEVGEGPFEITLVVKNLDQARKYLAQTGIPLESYPADSYRAVLPPEHTLGARLVLKEEAMT